MISLPNSMLATQRVGSIATAVVFEPQCLGRDTAGQLPDGTTDTGFIEIDDIEFF